MNFTKLSSDPETETVLNNINFTNHSTKLPICKVSVLLGGSRCHAGSIAGSSRAGGSAETSRRIGRGKLGVAFGRRRGKGRTNGLQQASRISLRLDGLTIDDQSRRTLHLIFGIVSLPNIKLREAVRAAGGAVRSGPGALIIETGNDLVSFVGRRNTRSQFGSIDLGALDASGGSRRVTVAGQIATEVSLIILRLILLDAILAQFLVQFNGNRGIMHRVIAELYGKIYFFTQRLHYRQNAFFNFGAVRALAHHE